MPGMDGDELTDEIRQRKTYATTPILMLSSSADAHVENSDDGDESPVMRLVKPARQSRLFDALVTLSGNGKPVEVSKDSQPVDETAPLPEVTRPGPDRLAESAEIDRLVNEALDDLTAIERAAFTLRHHQGRSIDEICRTLKLGKSAAKHAVFRAVRKLRAALAPLRLASDLRMPS